MADIKPGLSEISTETEAATPDAGAMQITAPKSTGIAGKIALDPTQTEAILSNMQKYIDERQSPMNLLMGGINRAYATTYGPSALAAHDQQKMQEDKQIMDYRTQMAAYRAAQTQAGNEAARYQGMTPEAGGTQAGSQSSAGGVPISPEQLAIESSLGTASEKLDSRRAYLKNRNAEKTKFEFAPGMQDKVDVYIPGEGPTEMTKAMAQKWFEKNPRLQAIVNGEKVPLGPVLNQAPAATPVSGAPTFSDPSIKINSGQRSTDEQQKLWDTSVKNGTPGVQPNGLPVAKPGTSPHEKAPGSAYDIDPKTLTRAGRTELAQKGYYQPLGIDSPHWEKIPVSSTKADVAVPKPTTTTATTPAPTVAAQPVQNSNETRQQYEQRIKEQGEIISSRVKEGEGERKSILDSRQSSIDTGNSISRIENTLNTPEGARAAGVFNKPGVVSAFGKILSEGIQAGNFGSVSFKGLEDAVRVAGGDQKTIDAAQRLARDFAQMQLNIAKRDLKGQGAVSDNERRIVEHVTGSTSNSPEVLKDFTRWNRVRNTFDKDVGDALQKWENSHPNQNYYTFKQSDEYKKLEAAYIAKTDEMAAKIGVNNNKGTPSDSKKKADELLKQYGPKKGS
jgi:hypothetical protein